MKLLKLKLENFQGIRAAEFDFGGQSSSIYGDNATGKTTVFNAMTWLLFDKASTGAKNFTPKTKGLNGDINFLDHAAEGTFRMEDGRIVVLRKVYHEVWKKKKGSATEEFDGHTTEYFIDGVPTQKKDYDAACINFCGSEEQMKMLTMPDYFPEQLPWEARRTILLEVCGDVDDATVIASTPELSELPRFLLMPGTTNRHYSVDEYKKIAQASKAEINKQIQAIPGRIDEATRAIPDTTGIDEKKIDAKIASLNTEREALEEQKSAILRGDKTVSDLRVKISDATAKLAESRAQYAKMASEANSKKLEEISRLQEAALEAKNAAQNSRADAERKQRELARMEEAREQLLKDYAAVQSEQWDEGAEICPTCGQRLPESDIQALKDSFNVRRSEKLERINKRGCTEASKEMIAGLQDEIGKLEEKAVKHEAENAEAEKEIATLRKQLVTSAPFEETEEYEELTAEIERLRSDERQAGAAASSEAEELAGKIRELSAKADEQKELKAKLRVAESQKERIEELKQQEKELGNQYEDLNQGTYLCELFINTKASLLTDRINSKFESVSFRLFIEQVNGGIREDCEVMIPAEDGSLVPFAFANNAGRINAGLEIIDTLARHWGITMPVFIDNAESVTKLKQMDTQVIRLVVSEADKALRLEVGA